MFFLFEICMFQSKQGVLVWAIAISDFPSANDHFWETCVNEKNNIPKDIYLSIWLHTNKLENAVPKTCICLITARAQKILFSPMTVGSRSTYTALGTCFPWAVSLKKVVKASSATPSQYVPFVVPLVVTSAVPFCRASVSRHPSGRRPCSMQYNSQHAFPICTPAWPMWTEMHSLWNDQDKSSSHWSSSQMGQDVVTNLHEKQKSSSSHSTIKISEETKQLTFG